LESPWGKPSEDVNISSFPPTCDRHQQLRISSSEIASITFSTVDTPALLLYAN
jgi:hypothetical protein